MQGPEVIWLPRDIGHRSQVPWFRMGRPVWPCRQQVRSGLRAQAVGLRENPSCPREGEKDETWQNRKISFINIKLIRKVIEQLNSQSGREPFPQSTGEGLNPESRILRTTRAPPSTPTSPSQPLGPPELSVRSLGVPSHPRDQGCPAKPSWGHPRISPALLLTVTLARAPCPHAQTTFLWGLQGP